MIRVSTRARRSGDGAGDPLDGLVNLFDLGIVLSVGFLIAALSSLNLTDALTTGDAPGRGDQVAVPPGAGSGDVPPAGSEVIGTGERVGSVYRLSDGRLVYVVPSPSAGPSSGPASGLPSLAPTLDTTPSPR
ncbi:DUF2149 domain-containing protein [Nocardioides sp. TRM66260-LWL]|uniref:DUF2149 domain-containing protein n=1 Tax=Nocardioides sp. TRM66260-LWL TaxID=2874478 RepID=UPI001CC56E76|nr:DUF2149 domain-containing protein [Nocardioides sp. TRM66260-LWL]MBZ5733418.1 DUF2149 domain-containing protein [Nocardioides sp. TRM66260-LWL]